MSTLSDGFTVVLAAIARGLKPDLDLADGFTVVLAAIARGLKPDPDLPIEQRPATPPPSA